jgi:hypothetical protein
MALRSDHPRRFSRIKGPDREAAEENSSMRPWLAPTYLLPNRSLWGGGAGRQGGKTGGGGGGVGGARARKDVRHDAVEEAHTGRQKKCWDAPLRANAHVRVARQCSVSVLDRANGSVCSRVHVTARG